MAWGPQATMLRAPLTKELFSPRVRNTRVTGTPTGSRLRGRLRPHTVLRLGLQESPGRGPGLGSHGVAPWLLVGLESWMGPDPLLPGVVRGMGGSSGPAHLSCHHPPQGEVAQAVGGGGGHHTLWSHRSATPRVWGHTASWASPLRRTRAPAATRKTVGGSAAGCGLAGPTPAVGSGARSVLGTLGTPRAPASLSDAPVPHSAACSLLLPRGPLRWG